MKAIKALSLSAALAAALLPAFAYADGALGAQLIGGADALAKFCSQVDPANARQFGPRVLELLGIAKASEDLLEAARRDPLYLQSYQVFDAAFQQQAPADAKRACAKLLGQTAPPTHSPPRRESHDPDKRRRD